MTKTHYHGASSYVGYGTTKKAKNRSGGIGDNGAAIKQERQKRDAQRKQQQNREIEANVRLLQIQYLDRSNETKTKQDSKKPNTERADDRKKPVVRAPARGNQLGLALGQAISEFDDRGAS